MKTIGQAMQELAEVMQFHNFGVAELAIGEFTIQATITKNTSSDAAPKEKYCTHGIPFLPINSFDCKRCAVGDLVQEGFKAMRRIKGDKK